MPKNWNIPIILKVTEPMRRFHQWWSSADGRIGQANTIRCTTVFNLLVKVRSGEDTCTGRRCVIEINRINFNGARNILKVLPTKLSTGDRDFPLNLIQNLAGNTNAAAVSDAF
jgi:hypothetical protein